VTSNFSISFQWCDTCLFAHRNLFFTRDGKSRGGANLQKLNGVAQQIPLLQMLASFSERLECCDSSPLFLIEA
jgi:hypothetical protein